MDVRPDAQDQPAVGREPASEARQSPCVAPPQVGAMDDHHARRQVADGRPGLGQQIRAVEPPGSISGQGAGDLGRQGIAQVAREPDRSVGSAHARVDLQG